MRYIKRILTTFLLCALFIQSKGQSNSQAYLIHWNTPVSDGLTEVDQIQWLSTFNKSGYNNQPYWDQESILLTYSNDNGSMDLIHLNPNDNTFQKITETPNYSEFSPTTYHGSLYFVRQNLENQYQELWKKTGTTLEKVSHHTNIAYYKVLTLNEVALITIENQQLHLSVYNTKTKEEKSIAQTVGRTLQTDRAGNLYYLHKYNDKDWYIKRYNFQNQKSTIVQKALTEAEDFFYDKDSDTLWMAKGSFLYTTVTTTPTTGWKPCIDLSQFSLNNIKRIAKNNKNQMVVINQ